MLEVTDDSGFLALVVPATYKSFVAANWTFDQIFAHFKEQMKARSLLIWGTGLEGYWRVNVTFEEAKVKGFREVVGPLQVVGQSLLVTNYESLTMAAQFEDVKLPEEHQKDLLLRLPDGEYSCRIIQSFDPQKEERAASANGDFLIEITATRNRLMPWEVVPWFDG